MFSRVSHGVATKAQANVTASVGSYFGVGANAYKQSSNEAKVPLISVTGVKFTVTNPGTYCGANLAAPVLQKFSSARDLAPPHQLRYAAPRR